MVQASGSARTRSRPRIADSTEAREQLCPKSPQVGLHCKRRVVLPQSGQEGVLRHNGQG